tara:strand:- start:103 stop:891 length:789 start_codon:yes stop_codon:yes gene_type:complete
MSSVRFVDGDMFRSICDFEFGEDMPDKEEITMYAASDDYLRALVFIEKNNDKKFRLVTHNGDAEINLNKRFLPPNLVCWYAQNLCTASSRTFPIPIGLENTQWHPTKRDIILNCPAQEQRLIRAFGQFNPVTHKSRTDLVNLIEKKAVDADFFQSINGSQFDEYVSNLSKYAFCLCPRGNGVDTHRIWEALYMGCIPIVQNHLTHKCLSDLPILFVDKWEEVTHQKLVQFLDDATSIMYNLEKLSFEYWQNLIKDTQDCGCK